MQVNVYHQQVDSDSFLHVAVVDVSGVDVNEALEYAWRWTNNVMGSWSIKEEFLDGEPNGDYNPAVRVVAPLHVDQAGKQWGHRSSMVGDKFVVDGDAYVVAMAGFKKAK